MKGDLSNFNVLQDHAPTHVLPAVSGFRRRHDHRRPLLRVPHPLVKLGKRRRRGGSSSDAFDTLQNISGRSKVPPDRVELQGQVSRASGGRRCGRRQGVMIILVRGTKKTNSYV